MIPKFPEITKPELDEARKAIAENSAALLSVAAMIAKLIKTAINEDDAMFRAEILSLMTMIQAADPILDTINSNIDRARMDAEHQAAAEAPKMQPARPPLKRGRGMVKVVTSQRFPTETPGDVFDSLPSTIVKRPSFIQPDDPLDDEIPMDFDPSDRRDAFRND